MIPATILRRGGTFVSARRTMLAAAVSAKNGLPVSSSVLSMPALLLLPEDHNTDIIRRSFASNSNKKGFKPRRKANRLYRPIKPGTKKVHNEYPGEWNDHQWVDLGNTDDGTEGFGPMGAELIRQTRRERKELVERRRPIDHTEETLRMLDYYISESGSIEDSVGLRRGLMIDGDTEEERQEFLDQMDKMIEEERLKSHELDPEFLEAEDIRERPKEGVKDDNPYDVTDPETSLDPNQLAYGDWSEMLVTVDRTSKLWRGGRLESFRALVIGGNLNGCGGFGVGKSKDPLEAVAKASRIAKRNIYFVDRYQGNGLTRDIAGKQNNCKVVIRSTDNGLRGNPLVMEILKRIGITNASSKAYGRRTLANVVRGTFKALLTHESLEDIALKTGKRLMNLERKRRLQI